MNFRTNTIYGLSLVILLVLLSAVETVSQTNGMNSLATGATFTTTQPTSENQNDLSIFCLIYSSPMPGAIKWAINNNITLNSSLKLTGKFGEMSFSWPMFSRLPNKALNFLFDNEEPVIHQDKQDASQVVFYKELSGTPALPYEVHAFIYLKNLSPTNIDFRSTSVSLHQACNAGKPLSFYVPDKMSATLTYGELFASPDYLTAYESFVTSPRGASFNTILI